jgi:hypothetical protein
VIRPDQDVMHPGRHEPADDGERPPASSRRSTRPCAARSRMACVSALPSYTLRNVWWFGSYGIEQRLPRHDPGAESRATAEPGSGSTGDRPRPPRRAIATWRCARRRDGETPADQVRDGPRLLRGDRRIEQALGRIDVQVVRDVEDMCATSVPSIVVPLETQIEIAERTGCANAAPGRTKQRRGRQMMERRARRSAQRSLCLCVQAPFLASSACSALIVRAQAPW